MDKVCVSKLKQGVKRSVSREKKELHTNDKGVMYFFNFA